MPELAFRAFNDGSNIVAVAFPSEGGSDVLRQSVGLNTLELDCVGPVTPPHDMPFGTFSVKNRKSLETGGIELTINYDSKRVSVTPYSSTGSPIESYTVRYTFKDIGVTDARESDIQTAKSKAQFRIKADRLPLSDETWP